VARSATASISGARHVRLAEHPKAAPVTAMACPSGSGTRRKPASARALLASTPTRSLPVSAHPEAKVDKLRTDSVI